MGSDETGRSEPIDELVKVGSEITGAGVGATIGWVAGGPAGAVLGAVVGPLLSHVFREVCGEIMLRQLGDREKVRTGATFMYAVEKIHDNIGKGRDVREDDFFEKKSGNRTDAEEIAEGVLIAAQREHEEKKLRFYGNLLANIAFHSEIDKAQAEVLINSAQRLTYRQICLLSLFGMPDSEASDLRQCHYSGSVIDDHMHILLLEIYDLYTRGMIHCSGAGLIDPLLLNPSRIGLQGPGKMLFELMELAELDPEELSKLRALLV